MVVKYGYFSLNTDNELIAAGTHFFCEACLVARPIDDGSMDGRYCKNCFEFLKAEARRLPNSQHPRWKPRQSKADEDSMQKTAETPQNAKIGGQRVIPLPVDSGIKNGNSQKEVENEKINRQLVLI